MTQEQKFMTGLLEEFKDFVIDSMADGQHLEFEDHHDFLKACMATWIDMLDADLTNEVEK